MWPGFKFAYLRWLPFCICSLFIIKTLLFSPIHGVADNGDFWRVMDPVGIQSLSEPHEIRYKYVERHYGVIPWDLSKATNSAVLPAAIARLFSQVFSDGLFDLRWLGAIYLCAFLCGLFFLLRKLDSVLLSIALPWLAAEPSLFLHFNSFFTVAMVLCLWPWLLWTFIRVLENPKWQNGIYLALISLLIATSKPPYILVPLLLCFVLCVSHGKMFWQKPNITGLLLIAAFAFSIVSLSVVPASIQQMNNYQATFMGVGVVADNPASALDRLGVSKELHVWNRRSLPAELMSNRLPLEVKHIVEDLSRWRLLGVYFTEPGALKNAAYWIQQMMSRWPLGYLGNYERDFKKPGAELSFSYGFSHFSVAIFKIPSLFWGTILFAGIYLLALFLKRKQNLNWALLMFLLLNLITQWFVVILGDGFGAIHRHLIVSRLCFGLLLVVIFSDLVLRLRTKNSTSSQ